jgi:peptidoglycan/xylan/chitin deacetylase (PgdA/CDA1 family)
VVPGFGFEHFKQYDFLRDREVVLTFDDGPWPDNTPAVLKALADNCLKATFFEIGEHAVWHPEIAKQVAAAGNTIGSHTWSHKDLAKKPVRQRHRAGQAGDRNGGQCCACGGRWTDRAVLPLPRPPAPARDVKLSW